MTTAQIYPKEALDTVPCGLCGGKDARTLFTISGFPILVCRSCGMSYVSPRLNFQKLNDLYSSEKYFKSDNSLVSGYVDYVSDAKNILATYEKRFDWLMKKSGKDSPGKTLDVGCATGFSLELGLSKGWDSYGIELSDYAASVAIKKYGKRVHHGTLDNAPFEKGSFNTIIIWDVIEHVPDPVKTLKSLNALLAPGGCLSLITPDCGSMLARIMRKHWMEYAKPTEHIYFFSRKTMKEAFDKSAFEIIAASTAGKYVGLDFLVDRFCAYFPSTSNLKQSAFVQKISSFPIYIDPGDKMMVLARKL